MSCGRIALERVGIKPTEYYASEIDEYAMKVTQKNYPDTIQLGDVQNIHMGTDAEIDLIMGGSPCQGFSYAGSQLAFDDPRSKLFFEFVRLLEEVKPKYFLLENVRMKQEFQYVISKYLGVEPIIINSNLVSAQNRLRYYWTNIPNIKQPKDRHIMFGDILENGKAERDKSQAILATIYKENCKSMLKRNKMGLVSRVKSNEWRKISVLECERLQTLSDHYTEGVSNTQRYKMIGNAWTVDVIAHIFKGLK
jgi:DNA-cytosine methyltransferase